MTANVAPPPGAYFLQGKDVAYALTPRPRAPMVIEKILPARSLCIPFGSPGNLKSNLLMDMCMAIATGTPWLEGLTDTNLVTTPGFPVRQCPVAWIDVDNGEDVMAERVAAFARAYSAPPDTPFNWLCFPTPPISAARGLSLLRDYIMDTGSQVVVIDNLLRIAGVRDENASEMDMAMLNLRKLVEDTGAAIPVIHHRRKDTGMGRSGDSLRGHSSIEGAIDMALMVDRAADVVTVKCTKARRRPIETFAAQWTFTLQADGETLETARFFRAEVDDPKAAVNDALKDEIKQALSSGALNQSQIWKAIGKRHGTVVSALNEMVLSGEIRCVKGSKNNERVYENGNH